jgi:hypothetical protein
MRWSHIRELASFSIGIVSLLAAVGAARAQVITGKHVLLRPAEEADILRANQKEIARGRERLQKVRARFEIIQKRNPELPRLQGPLPSVMEAKLPKAFSWEARGGVTSIKDQGGAGTCWAFARVGALESALLIRDGQSLDLAEQDLIDCGRLGAEQRELEGIRYEKENSYKFKDATSEPTPACKANRTPFAIDAPVGLSLEDPTNPLKKPVATGLIKAAVKEHGPVAVNLHIPNGSAIGSFTGAGVFTEKVPLNYKCDPDPHKCYGSHIVDIVGWDDDRGAWRVKNSWDTDWGDKGFGWIAYGSNKIGMDATYYELASPDLLTSSVWEKSAVEEVRITAWPYHYFQSKYDELWKQGWRIHQLSTTAAEEGVLYSAVWRKGNDAEMQWYGVRYPEFQKKYDELWKSGWRLYLLANYVVKGEVYYSGVWRKTGGAEMQYYGLSWAAFQKKYDDLWKQGWRLEILSNPVVKGQVLYNAVWRKSQDAEMQYYGLAYGDFQKKYDSLWKAGWRIHLLQNYRIDDKIYFNATWRKGQSGEIQWYGQDLASFGAKSQDLTKDGWRVRLLATY